MAHSALSPSTLRTADLIMPYLAVIDSTTASCVIGLTGMLATRSCMLHTATGPEQGTACSLARSIRCGFHKWRGH
jgi:hypothetical protein